MLRHAEGLRQMYDKTKFAEKIVRQSYQFTTKVTTKLRQNVQHVAIFTIVVRRFVN